MKYILDYEKYNDLARRTISEGQVLLENRNNILPFKPSNCIAVYGRAQNYYYKSGTGSGGMVNVNKVVSIIDALKENASNGKIKLDEDVLNFYAEYEKVNPFKEADGWANREWNIPELKLEESFIKKCSEKTDIAVIIIGRTAGEDQDNSNRKGSYLLTDEEEDMLSIVRRFYKKLVVVLNVGNIIDMKFVQKYNIDAVLYAWQGGMLGGYGTVDVLLGDTNPSGKLSDTIAYNIEDYPAHDNFGDPDEVFYKEDIFVGYRYFETFAKDKVLYPFGYGMSYTDFSIDNIEVSCDAKYDKDSLKEVYITCDVKNIGASAGKQVVQIYIEAPNGKLGKAKRVLAGFKKTKELSPKEGQKLSITIDAADFASFDETGICGLGTGFVLEKGEYNVYVGDSVRAPKATSFNLDKDILIEKLNNALGPVKEFKRLTADGSFADVPLRKDTQKERRAAAIPKEVKITGDLGYKLKDVANGKVSMDDFVGQLTLEELNILPRGEGMSSTLVTAGTASAFGGTVDSLKDKGIPIGCMDDGPSGMRLDSGMKAFSLPNGTLMACTFNCELIESLYEILGIEMLKNKVDVLLGPGMNIHRHPLNGRNFEYFSEDPYLTGMMGVCQLRGLKKHNVTGTIKHFACNNQEHGRHKVSSVVSERALREIYLKGFEKAVKLGKADAVMTTYGKVNGVWTAGCYDLNTTILRNEWGFKGIVMTDWWAMISEEGVSGNKTNFAGMLRAQNDLYMCVPKVRADIGDNILSSIDDGSLSISELQRTAKNVCGALINYATFIRLTEDIEVEVINAEEGYDEDAVDVEYIVIGDDTTIDLSSVSCEHGTKFYFGTELSEICEYEITITGRGLTNGEINNNGDTAVNDLAQLPVVFFSNAVPMCTYTFNGNGQTVTISNTCGFYNKLNINFLYFNLGGVKLDNIRFIKKST